MAGGSSRIITARPGICPSRTAKLVVLSQLGYLEINLCNFWISTCVIGKPHRIAIAMFRYDRERTDGLGADPDTAIYLEPLGGPLGGSFSCRAGLDFRIVPSITLAHFDGLLFIAALISVMDSRPQPGPVGPLMRFRKS